MFFHSPFPPMWSEILEKQVFYTRLLTEEERSRLERLVAVLVRDKYWEGARGLAVTDAMRVVVAGQAALLLLGFDDYSFDELSTILLYPGGYLYGQDDIDEAPGRLNWRLGEAHHRGPVVLSWWHAAWDGRRLAPRNLVLHEFAHKLAELGEPHLGRPPSTDRALMDRWEKVVAEEFERLAEDATYGRPTVLDPYGATDRAEFFAVATESFFLRPADLRRRHPDLYDLLARWYRQDPAARLVDERHYREAEEAEREYMLHAVEECTVALRLRPNCWTTYRHRAYALSALGEHVRARADADEAIRRAPRGEKPDAFFDRGLIRFEAKDDRGAIDDFTEALRRDGRFADAYKGRGGAHLRVGAAGEALADFRAAAKLDPRDENALVGRARAHAALEEWEKALTALAKALRLAPHVAAPYVERAKVRQAMGNRAGALADCEEALRLEPRSSEAHAVRAGVLEAEGDVEGARRDRERADWLRRPR